MRRASEAERERLHKTFSTLCRIESPSGRERPCADWITAELTALGLAVDEDGAGPSANADAGNLYASIPGSAGASVMMCAHMDTVPPTAPIEPTVRDGGWVNANAGILGADNKAAIAVMLGLARRLVGLEEPLRAGLELVFTVSEENGLHGAKAFEIKRLRSPLGYVFDHASPIGEIIAAAPTYQLITAVINGRAAHAGLRPELGRNAIVAASRAIARMPSGRIDGETTANVGTISGGTAANVVAERCGVEVEVRGIEEPRVETLVTELIDLLQDAADAGECDLDVNVQRMFRGYRLKPRAPQIELAERALAACGYQPRLVVSGGGSDANVFGAAGFACANLANGTECAHQPDERVSVTALEGMLEVAIELVEQVARTPAVHHREDQR
ncbi:MAG: M20/M25/M40 family metallo-hydrolase [Solirubrobacteraceae bacterium]